MSNVRTIRRRGTRRGESVLGSERDISVQLKTALKYKCGAYDVCFVTLATLQGGILLSRSRLNCVIYVPFCSFRRGLFQGSSTWKVQTDRLTDRQTRLLLLEAHTIYQRLSYIYSYLYCAIDRWYDGTFYTSRVYLAPAYLMLTAADRGRSFDAMGNIALLTGLRIRLTAFNIKHATWTHESGTFIACRGRSIVFHILSFVDEKLYGMDISVKSCPCRIYM